MADTREKPACCEVCGDATRYLTSVSVISRVEMLACDRCRAVRSENRDLFVWVLTMLGKLPKQHDQDDMM